MSRYASPRSQYTRAVRALGGVRVAERAEQLRARGFAADRVAQLLGVPGTALEVYYALQDELAGAA